jgi:predicted MFS family arabinose efflux permease
MQKDPNKPVEATIDHVNPSQEAYTNDDPRHGPPELERPSTSTELPLRETKTNRRSRLWGYNMNRLPRVRSMSYDQTLRSSAPQQMDDHRDHDFEDIALAEIQPTVQTWDVEPPRRTLRNSLHRISNRLSLTPSDFSLAYPPHLFPQRKGNDEPHKAETILGLRPSKPPPVPLKVPQVNASDRSSTPSLPLQNKPLPPRPVQPLNGRTAWLHAIAAVLVVGNCWGIGNAFGLFQAYYTRIYLPGTSPSTIAWIGSTQLCLVFGLGVPVGRLVDLGFFRAMFHGGTLLMIIGLFTSSVCTEFWSLWLTQGIMTGFGMGMVFCSGTLALMSWFDERKMGVAMGLAATGSCIGGIVYVLLARHFLETQGFSTTMRILGGVAAATMIPPNLIFRMREQTPRQSRNTLTTTKPLRPRVFTSPAYLCAAAGMFLTFLGVYFGFVYIVTFASEVLELSNTASANLLIFMLAANLPGRFLPALISDKCIGPLNTIIPAAFLSSAVIWLWTASSAHPNQASLMVIACFYGFVSAGVQVFYAPTVYSFCLDPPAPGSIDGDGSEPQLALDKMGIRAGGIFSCIGLACLMGTPIGGALISHRVDRGMEQPFLGAQIFAGSCLLVGGGFLLASRVLKVGWAAKRA